MCLEFAPFWSTHRLKLGTQPRDYSGFDRSKNGTLGVRPLEDDTFVDTLLGEKQKVFLFFFFSFFDEKGLFQVISIFLIASGSRTVLAGGCKYQPVLQLWLYVIFGLFVSFLS